MKKKRKSYIEDNEKSKNLCLNTQKQHGKLKREN